MSLKRARSGSPDPATAPGRPCATVPDLSTFISETDKEIEQAVAAQKKACVAREVTENRLMVFSGDRETRPGLDRLGPAAASALVTALYGIRKDYAGCDPDDDSCIALIREGVATQLAQLVNPDVWAYPPGSERKSPLAPAIIGYVCDRHMQHAVSCSQRLLRQVVDAWMEKYRSFFCETTRTFTTFGSLAKADLRNLASETVADTIRFASCGCFQGSFELPL